MAGIHDVDMQETRAGRAFFHFKHGVNRVGRGEGHRGIRALSHKDDIGGDGDLFPDAVCPLGHIHDAPLASQGVDSLLKRRGIVVVGACRRPELIQRNHPAGAALQGRRPCRYGHNRTDPYPAPSPYP